MLILALVVVIVLLHWFIKTRRQHGEPPILSGSLPLVGHGYVLFRDTAYFWKKFKEISYSCLQNGHAFYFLIGTQKFYVLTDPEDIQLVSNLCVAKDTVVGALIKKLLGPGLVFADVPIWRKRRKLIMPSFNQQILDGFIPIMNNQAMKLVQKLESEEGRSCFDPTPYVSQNILESICLTTMDVKLEEAYIVKFLEAYDQAISNGIETYRKFWLHNDFIYKMSDMKIKQDKCLRTVHDTSALVLQKKLMENERTRPKFIHVENNIEAPKKDTPKCFADFLLESGELTEEELRDEVNGMILAGTDTTSTVLVYVLLMIASYPEVQEKIYSELQEVFEGTNRDVKKQDLSRLVYLEAVLKETLRYQVMVPFVIRHIDKEIKLKRAYFQGGPIVIILGSDDDILGKLKELFKFWRHAYSDFSFCLDIESYTLKPGNNCFFSFYGVHRHPMWGDDVEEFKPQRWLDTPSQLPDNPNAFMAFSVGKRNCMGRTFGMMTMKILLSHVFRRYRIHADHTKMKLKLDVITKPYSGHFISIEKRNK